MDNQAGGILQYKKSTVVAMSLDNEVFVTYETSMLEEKNIHPFYTSTNCLAKYPRELPKTPILTIILSTC